MSFRGIQCSFEGILLADELVIGNDTQVTPVPKFTQIDKSVCLLLAACWKLLKHEVHEQFVTLGSYPLPYKQIHALVWI